MHLGNALRKERRRRGVTQRQLADRLGLHAISIGLIEKGAVDVALQVWVALSVALDWPGIWAAMEQAVSGGQ